MLKFMMIATHYTPRKISEINLKTDSKIAIVGKIVELGENCFYLKDESGRLEVFFDGEIEKDKIIRVFCSVVEDKVKADVIQSLNGLDLNLFKKVEELYSKAGLDV